MKTEKEKIYMRGFKGFGPGLVCEPNGLESRKQYAEYTVFEEGGDDICGRGVMHFCEHPMAVFGFYSPANNGILNDFAEVEALAPSKTDDKIKFCTTKLRIKAKLNFAGMCKAAIDFVMEHVDKTKKQTVVNDTASNTGDYSAASNTGNRSAASNTGFQSAASNTGFQSAASNTGFQSAASNTGDQSAASNTGDYSAASNTGDRSAASVSGKESFAIATGREGKARGSIGCWIACAEWADDADGNFHPVAFKSVRVDGKKIKGDTYYALKNGKFIEVE
jgi:hypothetical protein